MLAERWVTEPSPFVELDNVQMAFSKAAKDYHQHNVLQRYSHEQLTSGLAIAGKVLDVGAGPGTHYGEHHAELFCIDIAHGMLKTLKQNFSNYHAIQGDAHDLPLASDSIDLLLSNVALQWCNDFPKAIVEASRVIKADGELHISMVADGSLQELRQLGLRINPFKTKQYYAESFRGQDWDIIEVSDYTKVCYFEFFKELLYSIKGVGASIPLSQSSNRARLRGRRDWQSLIDKADAHRTPQGLPLTYHIVQIRAKRK